MTGSGGGVVLSNEGKKRKKGLKAGFLFEKRGKHGGRFGNKPEEKNKRGGTGKGVGEKGGKGGIPYR